MKHTIPHTTFTARLSGSAKETELRLHNIFRWKKKRPPVLFLLAAFLVVSGCGSLAEPNNTAEQEPVYPQISMDVQYYDTNENYIEIPTLVLPNGEAPNDGITAINQALNDLKGEYQTILNGATGAEEYGSDGVGNHCLLYPTTTDRYINLLFFREMKVTDLNTGYVLSLVYDKEEGRQVTMEDALALAGLTEQELYDALSAQYDPQLAQQIPDAHIIIQNQSLEGFRMSADGTPIFYLTARSDDADDTAQDYISGGENLYIWSDGTFACYDQYTVADLKPLVPTGETVKLDPPLWCQWYFESGEPEGGFTAPEITSTEEPTGNHEDAAPSSVSQDKTNASTSPDKGNEDQKSTQPLESLTPMEAYKAILQGEVEFRDTLSGKSFDISRVQEAITPDTSITIKPDYFAAVDLDADGTSEVIVSLSVNGNQSYGSLVLRYQDGVVYGYTFAAREFSEIRTDGTFEISGGAADVGICKITFDKDAYSIDKFTYSESYPDSNLENGDGISYFVDHQEATEEEWNLALSQWKEIPYVKWYELTDANIEAVLQ